MTEETMNEVKALTADSKTLNEELGSIAEQLEADRAKYEAERVVQRREYIMTQLLAPTLLESALEKLDLKTARRLADAIMEAAR